MEWPYTLYADPVTEELIQRLPMDRTAYALRSYHHADVPASWQAKNRFIETNHAGRYHPQVCIIGYARQMHTLTAAQLDWLAEVVFAPILDLTGIPNRWPVTWGEGQGIVLASIWSPIRMSPDAWEAYSGIATHQIAPAQDHWDPGRLDTHGIQARIETMRESENMPIERYHEVLASLGEGDKHPFVMTKRRVVEALIVAGLVPGPRLKSLTSTVDDAELRAAWLRFEEKYYGKGAPGVNGTPGPSSWPRALTMVFETIPGRMAAAREALG